MQMLIKNTVRLSADELRFAVVWTCRILVMLNLDSGPFGNVSIRIPGTQQFWVNPTGITFDNIKAEDVLRVDLHGKILEGKHTSHPGEFIHREIYRARADVGAIVHTHSENTVMQSLLGKTIEPYTQLGAAIYNDQGLYLGFSGPVRTSDEGSDIAKALGQHAIVIAKNHGLFACASTIQSALWDMVIADAAAKIDVSAKQMNLKSAELLTDEFLQKSKIEVRDKQCYFMWQNYIEQLRMKCPELFIYDESMGWFEQNNKLQQETNPI